MLLELKWQTNLRRHYIDYRYPDATLFLHIDC